MMDKPERKRWARGIIETDAGQRIAAPGMTEGELRHSMPNIQLADFPSAPGYRWFVTDEISISGIRCRVAICFIDSGCIHEASVHAITGRAPNWESVTPAEGELDKQWVLQESGHEPCTSFEWGNIVAGFNSKSGFSSIVFKYKAGTRI